MTQRIDLIASYKIIGLPKCNKPLCTDSDATTNINRIKISTMTT